MRDDEDVLALMEMREKSESYGATNLNTNPVLSFIEITKLAISTSNDIENAQTTSLLNSVNFVELVETFLRGSFDFIGGYPSDYFKDVVTKDLTEFRDQLKSSTSFNMTN